MLPAESTLKAVAPPLRRQSINLPVNPVGAFMPNKVPVVLQVVGAVFTPGSIKNNGNVVVPEPPVNSVPVNLTEFVEAAPALENVTRPVADRVVKAPDPGVPPPIAPGAAKVAPLRVVELIVPLPLTVSDAPVPTIIAALAFVPEVMAEKASPVDTAAVTNAVVASWVVLVPGAAVGARGAPVKVGLADRTKLPVPVWLVVVSAVPPLIDS